MPARMSPRNPTARSRSIRDAAARHREARGGGGRCVGWYHSHPNGVAEPSPTDAARAVEDGKLWLIAAAGAVTAWRAWPDGAVHGRFAAVALVAA